MDISRTPGIGGGGGASLGDNTYLVGPGCPFQSIAAAIAAAVADGATAAEPYTIVDFTGAEYVPDARVRVVRPNDLGEAVPGNVRTIGAGKDHATITLAILAASDGDVLMADAGNYIEQADFGSKSLTLIGIGGRTACQVSEVKCSGRSYIQGFNIDGGSEAIMISGENPCDMTFRDCRMAGIGDLLLPSPGSSGVVRLINCDCLSLWDGYVDTNLSSGAGDSTMLLDVRGGTWTFSSDGFSPSCFFATSHSIKLKAVGTAFNIVDSGSGAMAQFGFYLNHADATLELTDCTINILDTLGDEGNVVGIGVLAGIATIVDTYIYVVTSGGATPLELKRTAPGTINTLGVTSAGALRTSGTIGTNLAEPAKLFLTDPSTLGDITFQVGAEAADTVLTTVQLLDKSGLKPTSPQLVTFWLSDTAGGARCATAPSGTTGPTTGTLIAAFTAKTHGQIMTDQTGKIVFSLVEAGTDTWYLNVAWNGVVRTSDAITTAA